MMKFQTMPLKDMKMFTQHIYNIKKKYEKMIQSLL